MTFDELKARIADWLNRDDLGAQIPAFVSLAEARFNRRLIVPEREQVSTAIAATGSVALPVDFWAMRAIHTDSLVVPTLTQMSLVALRRTYPGGGSGIVRHFAISGSDLLLGPAPAADTALVLDYFRAIPALSSSCATNWLLDAHPDLYLAGALAEAFVFLRDTEGASIWDSRTEAKIAEIEKAGRRKTTGAAPLAPRAVTNLPRVRA